MYAYELLDADGKHVEFRASQDPLVVGPGAHGEMERMRAIPLDALPASPAVELPGVSADDLAAALVAKGVIKVADLPARAQAAAAAAVATIALEDGPAVVLGAPTAL